MTVGIIAMGIAVFIGVIAGSLAGYYGGWVDATMLRIIEVVLCFPTFILILSLIAFLDPSIYNIMFAIGLTRWPRSVRWMVAGVAVWHSVMKIVRVVIWSLAG